MNESINKESFFNKIQKEIIKNYKILLLVVAGIIFVFGGFQFYHLNNNNKILNTSIKYNNLKSEDSAIEFYEQMRLLSKDKSFYGIIASLELINYEIQNNEYERSYDEYLVLLNNNKLNNLYKTAIAIQSSYNLLDTINNTNKVDISDKIKNLLEFVDTKLDSYNGFRLEILFLLSIIEQDNNEKRNSYDESNKLYKEIIENDQISSSLKERVKKIHEFEIYN